MFAVETASHIVDGADEVCRKEHDRGRRDEEKTSSDDSARSARDAAERPKYNPFALALKGDVRTLRMLLDEGRVKLRVTDQHGWTLLHRGASKGHLEVVEALLKEARKGPREDDGDETDHEVGDEYSTIV